MRASHKVYEKLHADIMDGKLPPGTVLTEIETAADLGLSRTPVREAFGLLRNEGLLTVGARGAVVTDIQPVDIVQLFDLRAALEVKQAQLAARLGDATVFAAFATQFSEAGTALYEGHLDPKDHFAVICAFDVQLDEACDNPYLVAALQGTRTHLARVRNRTGRYLERMIQATHEHATIASAIAAGDSDLAATATHVHLANSLAYMLRLSDGQVAGQRITV